MNRDKLLKAVCKGYPDGIIKSYWKNGKFNDKASGDSLAEFIVREVLEAYDMKTTVTDEAQIYNAINALERAESDLKVTIDYLHSLVE